jgi:CheY-like chemotaxis protein
MQAQSHSLTPLSDDGAFIEQRPLRAIMAATFSAVLVGEAGLLSGETRYRNPFLGRVTSLDPVRVLIVSKLHECVAIAALVHSIGRFSTRMACSAASALTRAADFAPDIVLLTTDLPDLASYQVAAALRWRTGRSAPRLVAMTDDITASDRSRALASGFEQYLTVPVRRTALESVLLRRVGRVPRPAGGFRTGDN